MSTTTIQQNILFGLGEGINVANSTSLEYALRWANAAYRDIFLKHRFKHLRTRTVFRTADGQQTYQAPSDFVGFVTLKDESNDTVLDQVTPEEFARDVNTTTITDESFDSDFDTAVDLDYQAILQYSETVTTTAGTTTYTRDTDYTMDYVNGTITVIDSGGSMSDSTEYYIDYLYYTRSQPTKFCLEYDAANAKYVFRLDPTPDAIYIGSLVYPALPAALSDSVDVIWARLEYAMERGGIYFGSLELIENPNARAEFRALYKEAIGDLIRLDLDLVPKHDTIPLIMRRSDYTSRTMRPI